MTFATLETFTGSDFSTMRPDWFPMRRKGQIVLQDHDAVVWFRDIKIRVEK